MLARANYTATNEPHYMNPPMDCFLDNEHDGHNMAQVFKQSCANNRLVTQTRSRSSRCLHVLKTVDMTNMKEKNPLSSKSPFGAPSGLAPGSSSSVGAHYQSNK